MTESNKNGIFQGNVKVSAKALIFDIHLPWNNGFINCISDFMI